MPSLNMDSVNEAIFKLKDIANLGSQDHKQTKMNQAPFDSGMNSRREGDAWNRIVGIEMIDDDPNDAPFAGFLSERS